MLSRQNDAQALLAALRRLRADVDREGRELCARWGVSRLRRAFRPGAVNLARYLSLRRPDLRDLQADLIPWGLSSLGRSESRALETLDAVIASLAAICREADPPPHPSPRRVFRGERMLARAADELLGPPPRGRAVRIMVTLPTEAGEDPALPLRLVRQGMDCARINCAHDGPDVWARMVAFVRQAERETGRICRILMDLGGPKVRTAEISMPKGHERLHPGDSLLLTRGRPDKGRGAQAQCTLPEALDQIAVGAAVSLDDGKVGARVEALPPDGAHLRITHAPPKGYKLRPDKSLNFPETDLRIEPLTDKDRQDLDFIAGHADMVGYSFVQSASDMALLQEELARRGAAGKGIVAKIETARAVERLPEIIVQGAGRQPFGVMIARGDLAIEIGYERLAEIQEEMLWLCEAAHVPAIWATQVLESHAKTGVPSRAEITDAAMGERAECVMLNKGPFIAETITALGDVLARMEGHFIKKTAQLRALRSWNEKNGESP